MARSKKVNAFDERRIAESCRIEFLYWQYAVRKFYYDGKKNIINVSEYITKFLVDSLTKNCLLVFFSKYLC